VSGLAPSLSRSSEGLVIEPAAHGGEKVRLEGRYQSAAMAKVGADGRLVTDCVDTVEDAEAFLLDATAMPPVGDR
jgi:hypothetical protein